jgi:hypothetical protein
LSTTYANTHTQVHEGSVTAADLTTADVEAELAATAAATASPAGLAAVNGSDLSGAGGAGAGPAAQDQNNAGKDLVAPHCHDVPEQQAAQKVRVRGVSRCARLRRDGGRNALHGGAVRALRDFCSVCFYFCRSTAFVFLRHF